MKGRGFDRKLKYSINLKKTKSYIRTNNTESKEFVTREDMRQEGVLNLTTSNAILDEETKEVKGDHQERNYERP